jgi:hypothetical protein
MPILMAKRSGFSLLERLLNSSKFQVTAWHVSETHPRSFSRFLKSAMDFLELSMAFFFLGCSTSTYTEPAMYIDNNIS